MIKAVIFDFDGVIAESFDIKTNAFRKLFSKETKDAEEAIIKYHVQNGGVSRLEKFKYIYQNILKRELTEEKFKALCRDFSNLVMDEVVKCPYVKGAREFLEEGYKKFKFYVVSGTPQFEMEEIIKRKNIAAYFRKIYGSPPEKTISVKDILTTEGLLGEDAVYIGDALSDYEAAVVNSVKFIARINSNEELFNNIECIKIKDLSNIGEILRKL